MSPASLTRVLASAVVICVLVARSAGLAVPSAAAQEAFSPDEVRAIERIVRDVLEKDPEIILRAIERLRASQEQQAQERTRQALVRYRDALLSDPDAPVAGNPAGDVTVVEFFDYQCPYCKRMVDDVRLLIAQDDNVRFVFKEFPILGPASHVAARAALAAARQGKYQRFHVALMRLRGRLDEATVFQTAAEVGLDVPRLRADMNRPEIERMILRNLELARRLGIEGTPAFVIGDKLAPGAVGLDALRRMVAEARKG